MVQARSWGAQLLSFSAFFITLFLQVQPFVHAQIPHEALCKYLKGKRTRSFAVRFFKKKSSSPMDSISAEQITKEDLSKRLKLLNHHRSL
ncbi:hypothetical protein GOP47_0007762 [Adiantum capillus-veneris]|uniref:Uncharacterized protein n=1 Tax=Adiantum capillus-veneris TaxID=13818 RepID=A0A9D4V1I4_ADICA|nr:hypothetical protein GOP47_0007762 [Adiantum capillus-veneris]